MFCGDSKWLQTWTGVCHQIFGGLKVQTMWNLQTNVWCVQRRLIYLIKICLQMGLTWVCHNEPESKRESMKYKYRHSGKKRVQGAAVSKGHVGSLRGHKIARHYWFHRTRCNATCWFFLAGSSSVPIMVEGSASPLTHTWLIECEALPHPHHLVMIKKVGGGETAFLFFILLTTIVHWFLLATIVGRRLHPPPQLGKCIRVSYFLVTIYIHIHWQWWTVHVCNACTAYLIFFFQDKELCIL